MKKVSASVVIKDQKVLLTRRKPYDNLAGSWEFNDGKIESGKNPQQYLKREIEEELGILSVPGEILCQSVSEHDHCEFIIIAILTELVSENFEYKLYDRIEWVDIKELLDYKLLQADIPIAEKVISKWGITN